MTSRKPCLSVRRSKYDPGIWFVNSEEWQASVALVPLRKPVLELKSTLAFWFRPLPLTSNGTVQLTCLPAAPI